MLLNFKIIYATQWGDALFVELVGEHPSKIALTTTDGYYWQGQVELVDNPTKVHYKYSVWRGEECLRRERMAHELYFSWASASNVYVEDMWRDTPSETPLYSSAFSGDYEVGGFSGGSPAASTLTIRALVPMLHACGECLALVGEGEQLGNWDLNKALRFSEFSPAHWQLTFDASSLEHRHEYKLVRLCVATGEVVEWEKGENRELYVPRLESKSHFVAPEVEPYFPGLERRVAGTAIPVFSLRSEGSQGVGDFGDLQAMIDWIVSTGQRALQILPINDTTMTGTWRDSYPYNSISIYAFHPIYIDLRQVAHLKDREKQAAFMAQWRQLNALPEMDYERVYKLKRDYLLLLFREEGEGVQQSSEFQFFFHENEHWLRPYAAFSYLRDKYGTAAFSTWPTHSVYAAEAIAQLCQKDNPAHVTILFYCYLQYLLHLQLSRVSQYAREKGVILKGDIPIGISRSSVEAWVEPHYFNMNGQAGAPPDAFSTNGQNWGFPTYNWEAMRLDGYQWWRRRFAKMAEYFTAYRIDHILGFFRIWEIPTHSVQGLLGQFSPALPLSLQEISDFGLHLPVDFMTRPFINEELLQRLFGERGEWVKRTFLTHSHYDIWHLRPEYATQRQVENYFTREAHRLHQPESLRDGMYTLINNVLLVEDHKQRGLYHPRIAAQQTHIFERLLPEEREAFERMYHHYFYERHNEFWYARAMEKLPALLAATKMLPCGEDLGMVPACVPWAMSELQILSLEVERMSKCPNEEFGQLIRYPKHSVCTIGTHDMSTLRGWWKENPTSTAHYFYQVLQRGGKVPHSAPGWVCEEVLRRHLESPSLLAIFAWQDWLAIDEQLRFSDEEAERINIPANSQHYWHYRMHLSIETLLNQRALNQHIEGLIEQSGRGA